MTRQVIASWREQALTSGNRARCEHRTKKMTGNTKTRIPEIKSEGSTLQIIASTKLAY